MSLRSIFIIMHTPSCCPYALVCSCHTSPALTHIDGNPHNLPPTYSHPPHPLTNAPAMNILVLDPYESGQNFFVLYIQELNCWMVRFADTYISA